MIEQVDVDEIVTAEEFDVFLGGFVFSGDMKLAPEKWELHAKPARQYALDQVLETLLKRVPPIHYYDLVYPGELKLCVLEGAAEHLYQLAMSSGSLDDNFNKQRELWGNKFRDRLAGLSPTLTGGVRGPTRGFTVSRR